MWSRSGGRTAPGAEGRLLHERADSGSVERRPDRRAERGIALRSLVLGVVGKAVWWEFVGRPARPVPVEYKRGKPKPHRADEVQLCAQAICLEEMFGAPVAEGALYYGAIRRRVAVAFDEGLRHLTAEVATATRAMIAAGRTPLPVLTPGCRRLLVTGGVPA